MAEVDHAEEAAEREITPEQAKKLAETSKAKGNKAVGEKDYKAAVRHYTMAVNMAPEDGVYYSNRSAAYCGLGQYKDALKDAQGLRTEGFRLQGPPMLQSRPGGLRTGP